MINLQTNFITQYGGHEINMSNKQTIRLEKSNLELIKTLQHLIEQDEEKRITRTAIVNIAIAELFNKRIHEQKVDYSNIKQILKCYNVL